jgi:pyruvate dehydrogenase E1 component
MKIVPDQIAPWLPGRMVSLGTDGFGRSDNREHLRRHFEVDAESIAAATLSRLSRDGFFDSNRAASAIRELGLNPEKPEPSKA